jgi:hypothetical protein
MPFSGFFINKRKGVFSMKTRKHFIVMAIIAIITLALAVIGCKHDEPTPQEVPIGNVDGIPIYGFNSETALTNINNAYNAPALDSYRSKLSVGIKKIYILEGDAVTLYSFDKNTGVLKVGSGWTPGTYVACFRDMVIPALS